MTDESRRSRGLLGRLMGALGERGQEEIPERRASKRVKLPIPVRLRVGDGDSKAGRLRDFSQMGVCVEADDEAVKGERVVVSFEGYPEVCDPFVLSGTVVRVTEDAPTGLVVHIDRQTTPDEALEQYRALVLHYIRHKPLLSEVGKGYFEGHCESCRWIGRAGVKKPTCPMCGGKVVPASADG